MLMFTPDVDRAIDFYSRNLGLRLSDRSDAVAFMHGIHGSDHHILAFARSETTGMHHCSWDVGGIDDIGLGAMHMHDRGYRNGWGLGRHVLGSNYFHYVQDPWGSFAEYSADIDYIPKTRALERRASRPGELVLSLGSRAPGRLRAQLRSGKLSPRLTARSARAPRHIRPARTLGPEEGVERGRVRRHRLHRHRLDALARLRHGHRLHDRLVQRRDDLRRRARTHQHALPGLHLEIVAKARLADRRNVLEVGQPRLGHGGKALRHPPSMKPRVAAVGVSHREIDVAREQRLDRGGAAAKRHVHERDARAAREQFSGQMPGRSGAARSRS